MDDLEPPFDKETFIKWRDARRGESDVQLMNNPLWHWLVSTNTCAYFVNKHFNGPSSYDGNAIWESQRYGQSKTELPDGRKVLIGGEHEDFYDPDFFIYNDVIVRHPDGAIDFYSYTVDGFPPTDFHSATLVGDKVIIVGSLGYSQDRKPGTTPILILDINSWTFTKQASTGECPGWIHEHSAILSEDGKSIIISGGIVELEDADKPHVDNIDDWQLHLADWRWERLSQLDWPLFELKRADGERNMLWEMRQGLWALEHPKFSNKREYPLPNDPEILKSLYLPDEISHRVLPEEEDDYNNYRIEISGVIVRYVEDHFNIMVTIEGDLDANIIKALIDDLKRKLTALEEAEYKCQQCRPVTSEVDVV